MLIQYRPRKGSSVRGITYIEWVWVVLSPLEIIRLTICGTGINLESRLGE